MSPLSQREGSSSSLTQIGAEPDLHVRDRDVVDAKNLLEEVITPVSEWLLQRGLRISPEKYILCPFSSKIVDLREVFINVDSIRVMSTSVMKYLGIILNSRLSWIPHIRENITRACKAINVLKVISKVSWGAAPALSLMVFRGLIRAYLEWGCQLYGSANASALAGLDRVQNSALRVALGVMSTTPIPVLLSESGEIPLAYRRKMLTQRFIIKNYLWRSNPLIPRLSLLSERIHSSACRMPVTISKSPLLRNFESMRGELESMFRTNRPAEYDYKWDMLTMGLDVRLDLFQERRMEGTSPMDTFSSIQMEIFPEYTPVFTDGSVFGAEENLSGSAFYIPESNFRFGVALQESSSVYSTEAYAILSAILYAKRAGTPRVLILSDARQVLGDIKNVFSREPSSQLIYRILAALCTSELKGQRFSFVWIPSHKGIAGNDIADRTARTAARTPFRKRYGLTQSDLRRLFDTRNQQEIRNSWPFFGGLPKGLRYFNNMSYDTERPWFVGLNVSRFVINFITRLRTGHIVCSDHFERLGWRVELDCPCGAENRSLRHLFNECPILSPGRPEFFGFLHHRLGIDVPERFSPFDVVMSPTRELVDAFGRFVGCGTSRIII